VSLLRLTLSNGFVREIFRDRALRLFVLFLAAVAIYLPLSFYFPLWMLALGPLIWGVPHIVASVRFQHYTISDKISREPARRIRGTMFLLGSAWLVMTLFRMYTDVFDGIGDWDRHHPGMIETLAALALAVGLAIHFKASRLQGLATVLFLVPLAYALWRMPFAVSGALILAHNFIAFFHWIGASRDRRDRAFAWLATAIFALIHVLMFAKVFDPLINLAPAGDSLPWGEFSLDGLGRLVMPWSEDPSVWYRAVSLYAFGQAVHYFVWIKAIPDTHAPSSVPTSFNSAWTFLKRDIGLRPALFACAASLIPLIAWAMVNFDWAHRVYFACASFHGYMEIAGLGLLLSRRIVS
jgi:hypothetical protein